MNKKVEICELDRLQSAISQISSHSLFSSAQRNSISRDWTDYLYTKEIDSSAVLAWLLNPCEGHGLGDYFLKKLIQQILNNSTTTSADDWLPYQISLRNMGAAIVQTEFPISINGNTRKIDIIVLDPISQVSIIIERKDGANETNNQLDDYYSWGMENLKKNNNLSHQVFFVLSGYSTVFSNSTRTENWVAIDDQWVCDALKEAIERDLTSLELKYSLQSLLSIFFGAWNEDDDNFYKNLSADTSNLRYSCDKDIQVIANAKFSDGKTISSLTRSHLLSKYFTKMSGQNLEALHFILKHYKTLNALLKTQKLQHIADQIILHGFIPEFATENHQPVIRASLKDMLVDTNDYWAAYLVISSIPEPIINEHSIENSTETFKVFLRVRRIDEANANSPLSASQINEATQKLIESLAPNKKPGKGKIQTEQTKFSSSTETADMAWLNNAASWFKKSWLDAFHTVLQR